MCRERPARAWLPPCCFPGLLAGATTRPATCVWEASAPASRPRGGCCASRAGGCSTAAGRPAVRTGRGGACAGGGAGSRGSFFFSLLPFFFSQPAAPLEQLPAGPAPTWLAIDSTAVYSSDRSISLRLALRATSVAARWRRTWRWGGGSREGVSAVRRAGRKAGGRRREELRVQRSGRGLVPRARVTTLKVSC